MEPVRLSPAQERALLGIPAKREFIPMHTGFQWPTLAKLKQLRLINGVLSGFPGKGKWARHVITPRGFKVRADLAIAAGARSGETTEELARSEGRQSGGTKIPRRPNSNSNSQKACE